MDISDRQLQASGINFQTLGMPPQNPGMPPFASFRPLDTQKAAGLSQRFGSDAINRMKTASPGVSRFVEKNVDVSRLSKDCMEELKGKSGVSNENMDNILQNLIDMKLQDITGNAKKVDASQAGNKPKEKTEVSWQPLIEPGQKVKSGQPWGQFNIRKEKVHETAQEQNAKMAMQNDDAIVQNAEGKENEIKNGTKAKQPQQQAKAAGGGQGGQKGQQGGSMGTTTGEDGSVYIIDSASGTRTKVPENGVVNAERDMDITFVGNGGRLEGGATLFSYTLPKTGEDRGERGESHSKQHPGKDNNLLKGQKAERK